MKWLWSLGYILPARSMTFTLPPAACYHQKSRYSPTGFLLQSHFFSEETWP